LAADLHLSIAHSLKTLGRRAESIHGPSSSYLGSLSSSGITSIRSTSREARHDIDAASGSVTRRVFC
jgi:hypothetical protein